jgi:hypothetical protein
MIEAHLAACCAVQLRAQRGSVAAPFSASAEWQAVKIPFSALARKADRAQAWTGRDLRALVFELSGAPESLVWRAGSE